MVAALVQLARNFMQAPGVNAFVLAVGDAMGIVARFELVYRRVGLSRFPLALLDSTIN